MNYINASGCVVTISLLTLAKNWPDGEGDVGDALDVVALTLRGYSERATAAEMERKTGECFTRARVRRIKSVAFGVLREEISAEIVLIDRAS